MTSTERFEAQLERWLAETAQPRIPDDLPTLLADTARMRQRPAWTFPERILPMSSLTMRRWTAHSVPIGTLGVLALILLVIVLAAIAVGARRSHVAPPFGVAANGVVALEVSGDIVISDPVSGAMTVVIGGPETDRRPMFSRDGSRMAFLRASGGDLRLMAAHPDGSHQIVLDTGPLVGDEAFDWSPTGASILVSNVDPSDRSPVSTATTVRVVPTDGSPRSTIELGMAATSASWHPPSGDGFMFLGSGADTSTHGIYLASRDGQVTPIVPRAAGVEVGYPAWDPTGRTIAFTEWDTAPDYLTARQRIADVATREVRTLPLDASATWGTGSWSNDGSRLVVTGFAKEGVAQTFFAAIIEGTDVVVTLQPPAPGLTLFAAEWSPNDQSIVGSPHTMTDTPQPQQLWDAHTGIARPAPWATTDSDWQRAPLP